MVRADIQFERTDAQIDGFKVEYIEANTKIPLICINPKYFRPAEVNILLGNPAAIEKDLKWERKISFQNLVERMVDKDLQLVQTFDS